MMKSAWLVMGVSVLLTSCATLEPEECKTADWVKLGYSDAMSGSSVMLSDYSKDCAKAGVTPDQTAYMSGYNNGAKAFCTYDKGVEVGEKGKSVSDLCNKPGLAEEFNRGLEKGKKLYAKQKEISSKEDERSKIEKKLNDIKTGKVQGSAQEVDMMYREKGLIEKEIEVLKREKAGLST